MTVGSFLILRIVTELIGGWGSVVFVASLRTIRVSVPVRAPPVRASMASVLTATALCVTGRGDSGQSHEDDNGESTLELIGFKRTLSLYAVDVRNKNVGILN